MGCCESTPRVDPGQQNNGFQAIRPRPVDVPPQQTTSQVPTQERDQGPRPSSSDAEATSTLPIIVEPPIESPGSDVSPGTKTPAVNADEINDHSTRNIGGGSSHEVAAESPPEKDKGNKDKVEDSSSSSSSSSSG